jgi:hypothetical protein
MVLAVVIFVASTTVFCDEEDTRNILKQGLVGAGAGALAAGASGGDAGKGALIGAGTNVIGSALLDSITGPSSSSRRRSAPPPDDEDYYYADEPEEYYEEPAPRQSASGQIIKQGLVGAGAGALAAGASGGDAGKGALIGAGTNVIGNALLDTITQPAEQRRGKVYRRVPRRKPATTTQEENISGDAGTRKKIIRKYDESGKVVSEEEVYY